jgi:hypothetical protein
VVNGENEETVQVQSLLLEQIERHGFSCNGLDCGSVYVENFAHSTDIQSDDLQRLQYGADVFVIARNTGMNFSFTSMGLGDRWTTRVVVNGELQLIRWWSLRQGIVGIAIHVEESDELCTPMSKSEHDSLWYHGVCHCAGNIKCCVCNEYMMDRSTMVIHSMGRQTRVSYYHRIMDLVVSQHSEWNSSVVRVLPSVTMEQVQVHEPTAHVRRTLLDIVNQYALDSEASSDDLGDTEDEGMTSDDELTSESLIFRSRNGNYLSSGMTYTYDSIVQYNRQQDNVVVSVFHDEVPELVLPERGNHVVNMINDQGIVEQVEITSTIQNQQRAVQQDVLLNTHFEDGGGDVGVEYGVLDHDEYFNHVAQITPPEDETTEPLTTVCLFEAGFCVVCMMPVEEDQLSVRFDCMMHIMHQSCSVEWLETFRYCPVCRTPATICTKLMSEGASNDVGVNVKLDIALEYFASEDYVEEYDFELYGTFFNNTPITLIGDQGYHAYCMELDKDYDVLAVYADMDATIRIYRVNDNTCGVQLYKGPGGMIKIDGGKAGELIIVRRDHKLHLNDVSLWTYQVVDEMPQTTGVELISLEQIHSGDEIVLENARVVHQYDKNHILVGYGCVSNFQATEETIIYGQSRVGRCIQPSTEITFVYEEEVELFVMEKFICEYNCKVFQVRVKDNQDRVYSIMDDVWSLYRASNTQHIIVGTHVPGMRELCSVLHIQCSLINFCPHVTPSEHNISVRQWLYKNMFVYEQHKFPVVTVNQLEYGGDGVCCDMTHIELCGLKDGCVVATLLEANVCITLGIKFMMAPGVTNQRMLQRCVIKRSVRGNQVLRTCPHCGYQSVETDMVRHLEECGSVSGSFKSFDGSVRTVPCGRMLGHQWYGKLFHTVDYVTIDSINNQTSPFFVTLERSQVTTTLGLDEYFDFFHYGVGYREVLNGQECITLIDHLASISGRPGCIRKKVCTSMPRRVLYTIDAKPTMTVSEAWDHMKVMVNSTVVPRFCWKSLEKLIVGGVVKAEVSGPHYIDRREHRVISDTRLSSGALDMFERSVTTADYFLISDDIPVCQGLCIPMCERKEGNDNIVLEENISLIMDTVNDTEIVTVLAELAITTLQPDYSCVVTGYKDVGVGHDVRGRLVLRNWSHAHKGKVFEDVIHMPFNHVDRYARLIKMTDWNINQGILKELKAPQSLLDEVELRCDHVCVADCDRLIAEVNSIIVATNDRRYRILSEIQKTYTSNNRRSPFVFTHRWLILHRYGCDGDVYNLGDNGDNPNIQHIKHFVENQNRKSRRNRKD